MYPSDVRSAARRLVEAGLSAAEVSRRTGISPQTVARWTLAGWPGPTDSDRECPRCRDRPLTTPRRMAYCYILGQYLGDGHLVTRARVPVLRVYMCDNYPLMRSEYVAAVATISGRHPGFVTGGPGVNMTKVQSYWMHWPCLLPQHGPGRKHTRPIVLADWQRHLAEEDPWPLIRGLIHSDGCRVMNSVVVRGKRYSYPRYHFANESRDIMGILQDALDRVGVEWRMNRPNSLSVARRASVAVLDEHIGPKR